MVNDVSWAAFVPAAFVMAAIPGANQLLALRNGLRHGPGRAIVGTAGRFTAFALMVIAVAAGLGAILVASQVAFSVIKWSGVAYLIFLGVRTIVTAGRDGVDTTAKTGLPASAWRLIRQEFVVAASNPKALILFTAFLPQFIEHAQFTARGGAGPLVGPLLAVGLAYIAVEFCCACGYAALGGRIGVAGIKARTRRWLDRGTGTAMLGLAGWLAMDNA